ncbi:hypothetical protein RCC89_10590 [Cytophagaceae bacterium ABcell3]|nr:hypothetical protein RCC89_10590 [Cytophagaceae bacterium ABcell3]
MAKYTNFQNQAHPNKASNLLLGIIVSLIGIISIQIWLLYVALNNALEGHPDIAAAAFIGSLVLFLIALWLIKYLPEKRTKHEKDQENKYE